MSAIHKVINKVPRPVKQAVKDAVYPSLLKEGQAAPDWKLQGWDGSWHPAEPGWSVLIFYPGDDTPGCTAQLQDFEDHYDHLRALGVEVYGINPADGQSHRDFAEKLGFRFPLLSDRGAGVARAFQCALGLPFGAKVIRSVYVVDAAGRIRQASRGAPSADGIVRRLEELAPASGEHR